MEKIDRKLYVTMEEWMPVVLEHVKKGEIASLKVRGVSMTPFLVNERDTVFLQAIGDRTIRQGDILMFYNGSYIMHRVYRCHQGGTFDFVGDHNFHLERNISKDQLVAYVPKVERNGRIISCESGAWRSVMIAFMKIRIRFPNVVRAMSRIGRMLP